VLFVRNEGSDEVSDAREVLAVLLFAAMGETGKANGMPGMAWDALRQTRLSGPAMMQGTSKAFVT
jgi:hypothetical protein